MLFSMYARWKCSIMVGNNGCFLDVLECVVFVSVEYALLLSVEGTIWMILEAMMQMVVRRSGAKIVLSWCWDDWREPGTCSSRSPWLLIVKKLLWLYWELFEVILLLCLRHLLARAPVLDVEGRKHSLKVALVRQRHDAQTQSPCCSRQTRSPQHHWSRHRKHRWISTWQHCSAMQLFVIKCKQTYQTKPRLVTISSARWSYKKYLQSETSINQDTLMPDKKCHRN